MKTNKKTVCYIDGANLHKGILSLGWKLDYQRFRIWLSHRYGVGVANIFLGLIPKYKNLYTTLQRCGFTIIYKEVVYDGAGKAKGNCDADLITQAMHDTYEGIAEQAIIVTSDGDYTPLVEFLKSKGRITAILSPAPTSKCSVLLKRTTVPIVYLNDKRERMCVQKEKAPGGNASAQGSSSW